MEEEEERLEKEGYYDEDEEIDDDDEAEILVKADQIREKQALIRNEAKMKKRLKNQAIIPRKKVKKSVAEMDDALDRLGVDTTDIVSRARSLSRPRGRSMTRRGTEDIDAMDIDTPKERLRSMSRARSQPATDRRIDGVQDETARTKAERQAKLGQRKMNRMARQGEADRHIGTAMPKHLVGPPSSQPPNPPTRLEAFMARRLIFLSSLLGSAVWARLLVADQALLAPSNVPSCLSSKMASALRGKEF